jgi:hypothetical protein
MEGFIRRENIKRYRKLLREAEDDPERRLIQKLLREEEQKRVDRAHFIEQPAPLTGAQKARIVSCPDPPLPP